MLGSLMSAGGGMSASSGVGGSDSNKQGSGNNTYTKTVYQVDPAAYQAQSMNHYILPGLLLVGAVIAVSKFAGKG